MNRTPTGHDILTVTPSYILSSDVVRIEGESLDDWFKRARAFQAEHGNAALWSGKGAVPEVGAYVDIAGKGAEVATVLGYVIDSGWLMLWCERHSDGRRGDLAGTEMRWA